MKKNQFAFIVLLFLNLLFSCNNESLMDQDLPETSQDASAEKRDSIQTRASCYGCLPMITAYHDPLYNEFVLAWSGFSANPVSHPITISYKVDGRTGSQSIISNSGEIRREVFSESYLATWSVKCSDYNCSSCRESGSILKKASGETETGSINECHKNYLNYSIEKVYNGAYDLILNDYNGDLYNTEKYMTINDMRCYEIDSYSGQAREIYSAGSLDSSSSSYRIRFYLYTQPMYKNFRVTFSNTKCDSNFEHYLYVDYYESNFGIELASSSLTLVRNH